MSAAGSIPSGDVLRRVREAGGADLLDRINETVRTDRGCEAGRMEAELARCFAD